MRMTRVFLVMLMLGFAGSAMAQQVKLTLWSHWAAEKIKRDFVEDAIKRFEAANPNIKIEASWYEKNALFAALKTSLRAGTGPDIFYAEPEQVEYMQNDLLLDLTPLNWAGIEPWAKEIWTYKGKPYGMPLEAWSVELYYNKKTLADLGVTVPASLQMSAGEFTDMIKKARAKNITPMSLGVGDRPYPGAFLAHEALLKKLGLEGYNDLLAGKRSWTAPEVLDALRTVRTWTEAGMLPTTFTTLKLGESHTYFYSNPGSATFLSGSFYPSRAFNPSDKGGQPAGFPLGIMNFPAIPGAACNECRTLAVGGSYVANAGTKHPKEAIKFIDSFVTPAMANRWLEEVVVQTGIKADMSKIAGPNADYLKDLFAANANAKYYFGLPNQRMQGKPREVFTQIFNNAFPAGNISVEDAAKQMNAAFGK
jgi:multiple sugar transport system substrate-binding protein